MQRAVEIQSRNLTLRGMLHIPDKVGKKVPVICIFHGFTGNKTESHFIFVKLSRMLESRGIGSVRFDFSGSGESDGDFIDMTISHELEEARDILKYTKTLDFVDTDRIGVLGLSLGGAVASMLAGEYREDVKSLCLWAPAGNIGELITRGRGEDDLAEIHKSGSWDLGGLSLGAVFLDDALSLDVYARASHYDKNVLILHGNKDQTVPVSTSEKYLEFYETRGILHFIEGSDHTFNKKAWEDEVLDYTIGFFQGEFNIS